MAMAEVVSVCVCVCVCGFLCIGWQWKKADGSDSGGLCVCARCKVAECALERSCF